MGHELAPLLENVLPQAYPQELLSVVRVAMVTRARYTEDRLLQRYHAGVEQYVILGAGLDSFAWRRPDLLPLSGDLVLPGHNRVCLYHNPDPKA